MKNKKVIAEINRAREIMGLELLNEQAPSPCMEMMMTVCYQGSGGQPPGTQVTYPCSIVDAQDPTQSLVGERIQDMGAGFGQGTWIVDSVTANPTYTTPPIPASEFTVHSAGQYPCGGQTGAYDCVNNNCIPQAGGTYSTANGYSSPLLDCQAACQPAIDDYECVNGQCVIQPGGQFTGPNAQSDCQAVCDCANHGVDNVNQTTGANPGGWFDPQGEQLVLAGNCTGIQNKINQITPCPFNWSQEKCDCRTDYLNLLLTICQSSTSCHCCPSNPSPNPNFITNMSTRWTNSIAANPSGDGCEGNPNNQNSGMCAKFKQFCPSSGPNSVPGGNGNPNNNTHACKCDYLWATYTCNC